MRDNLEVKEVVIENGSEKRRYVIVRNPEQAERDRFKRESILEQLGAEIKRLNKNSGKRGGKHTKEICALTSHPAVGRYVRELKNGELRIDFQRVRAEDKLDGKYLLYTSDPSLSTEDIALGYKQLAEVERAFRTLKTTLELRPIYHRQEDRIRSHVLLCWLALLLIRVIETETGESWEGIRDEMAKMHRIFFSSKDGTAQLTTTPTNRQRNLLKRLKITLPKPIQKVKIIP